MPNPKARGHELFKEIIESFKRQADPTAGMTLRQIANQALGLGSPRNASIVGRTIHEFDRYFWKQGFHKSCVNWRLIEEDHPGLFGNERRTTVRSSPISEMLQALRDEHRSVLNQIRSNPVTAAIVQDIGRFPDNSYLYEAEVALVEDAEMPIPEGVAMKLHWTSPFFQMQGTLLAYDALSSRVIFEVDQEVPRTFRFTEFALYPAVDELILAVRDRLKLVESSSASLPMGLLGGDVVKATASYRPPPSTPLDASQIESIRRCLEQNVTYLWGPPGTGKTHALAHLMAHLATSGQRVIAVAISNVAVDQMASRLTGALQSLGRDGSRLLDEGLILRFGYARLPEVTGESRLFPNRSKIQRLRRAMHDAHAEYRKIPEAHTERRALQQKVINDLKQELRDVTRDTIQSANVVLTTAVQTCLEAAFELGKCDVVVIDEASMMSAPFAMCAAALARSRVVVAGDFRQLGPIAAAKSELALKWLHRDLFAVAGIDGSTMDHPKMTMLTTQRRMHRDIRDMVNLDFYGHRLTGEGAASQLRSTAIAPLPGRAAVLIRVTPQDGSRVELTGSHSRFNDVTAKLTARMAIALSRQDDALAIGVIAPYRAQVVAIKSLVKGAGLSNEAYLRIKVGTVHAFQGSESDVVIWDLVDTADHLIGKLYQGDRGDRLANVAISRAQGKLVVVGDPEAFFQAPGQEMVKALKKILFRRFRSGRDTLSVQDAIEWCERVGIPGS